MGSEYKFVLFLVLAIIFFGIYFFGRKVDEYHPESFPAEGVIERINRNDRGRRWFYIKLVIDGKEVIAKTDSYLQTPKDLCVGDTVHVQYRHIAGGNVACYIDQEDFQRVIDSSGEGKPISLYCALVSMALFVFLAVKHFLR